ncbi:MAG: hypothetical protein IJJ28_01550, partial [Lentisphaeria bacterium]|nr:hypothetical protein [Lentisphaeria bacterium]
LKTDAAGNLIPAAGKTYITTQKIAVDGKKKYQISFEYKGGADNSGAAMAAVVAIPYDAKGRRIQGGNVDHIVGSETTLAENVPAGSDELILNANPAWSAAIKRKAIYAVGFGARKDFKDIPNFMVMSIRSQRVDEDGRIIVKLVRKTRSECKAGLGVRLHRYGWNGVGKVAKSSGDWQKMSFTIEGWSNRAVADKWWRGAKTARLAIYGDRRNGGNVILIRNLKLEEL